MLGPALVVFALGAAACGGGSGVEPTAAGESSLTTSSTTAATSTTPTTRRVPTTSTQPAVPPPVFDAPTFAMSLIENEISDAIGTFIGFSACTPAESYEVGSTFECLDSTGREHIRFLVTVLEGERLDLLPLNLMDDDDVALVAGQALARLEADGDIAPGTTARCEGEPVVLGDDRLIDCEAIDPVDGSRRDLAIVFDDETYTTFTVELGPAS